MVVATQLTLKQQKAVQQSLGGDVSTPTLPFVGIDRLPPAARAWATQAYGGAEQAEKALRLLTNYGVFALWTQNVGPADAGPTILEIANAGALWLACLQLLVRELCDERAETRSVVKVAQEAGYLRGQVELYKARNGAQMAIASGFEAAAKALEGVLTPIGTELLEASKEATPAFDAFRNQTPEDYAAFMAFASKTKLDTSHAEFLRPLFAPFNPATVPPAVVGKTGLPKLYAQGFTTAKHPKPFAPQVQWRHGNRTGEAVGAWVPEELLPSGHDSSRLIPSKIKDWNAIVRPLVQRVLALELLRAIVDYRRQDLDSTATVYAMGAAKDAAKIAPGDKLAQEASAKVMQAVSGLAPLWTLIVARVAQRAGALGYAQALEKGLFELQKFGTVPAGLAIEIEGYQTTMATVGWSTEDADTRALANQVIKAMAPAAAAAGGIKAAGVALQKATEAANASLLQATQDVDVLDDLIDATQLGKELGQLSADVQGELKKRFTNAQSIQTTAEDIAKKTADPPPVPPTPPPPPPPAGKGGAAPALGALALFYWLTR